MTVPDPTRLLIVDDHAVVRMGLATLFATEPSIVVAGEASTAAEARQAARRCQPDIIIMDVRLPDESGVEACRDIRSERPETRVLMLTSYADHEAVVGSIMAGAAGYVLKEVTPEQLIDAVRRIAHGGALLDPAVTQTVMGQIRRMTASPEDDPMLGLAEHERRLLPLIAEGKTNRQIAAQLHLSEHTVKTYISEILRKLHLSRRAEAAAYITRHSSNGI